MQPETSKDRLPPRRRVLHSPKPNLEITQATLPVGGDPSPQVLLHDVEALGDQEERGGRDHQHQAIQAGGIPQTGRFQTKQSAFVVQEAFFNLEALTVLRKRLHTGRFIAEDLLLCWAVCGTAQHHIDGAESLTGEGGVVEAAGFPRG